MDTILTKILGKATNAALYLVVFLIPLFFLPFTAENLELNKYFLFYILILISLLCHLGRIVMQKALNFRRSPLDIPILILWVALLTVSLFSEERYLSFFGDFSFLGISFTGFSLMFVFYFLLVQNLTRARQILSVLYLLLASGWLSAVYFILRSVKFFAWPNWPLPVHNLTHGSNTLFGIFLAVIFILSLSLLAIKKRNWPADIFFLAVLLTSGAALTMVGFKTVWIIAAAALFLSLVFFLTHLEEVRSVWISVSFAILVVALLFVFLGVPRLLAVELPLEVSLSGSVSWQIARDTLKDNARYFLFGTGPATFMYDFSKFRPADFNNNFAWNVRFRQPYSTALEWLSTTGTLGSLAFLLVILMVLGLGTTVFLRQILEWRRRKKNVLTQEVGTGLLESSALLFWGLAGGWLTLLIALFAVNFGAAHWFLFWLFAALLVNAGARLSKTEPPIISLGLQTSPQYSLVMSFGFILIFTVIIVLGIYLGRFFAGEIVYARALKEPLDAKLSLLPKAVELNPNRVLFYLTLADSFMKKAAETANKTNDVNAVSPLAASAVNAAKTATDKAPKNVASWEFLSSMYANARAVAPEANNWAVNALEKAMELEPTNPVFYVNLGNAKMLERRYSEAKEDFDKALSLKPDFLIAYLRLAFLKEDQKDINAAVAVLEKGLPYGRQDPVYVFHLGRYYYNRGSKNDLGLAEIAFQRALTLNPNYSDALYSLAALYEKTNHRDQALVLYRKVMELNPGNKDIKRKIELLSGSGEKK